jgi:putative membrane protein
MMIMGREIGPRERALIALALVALTAGLLAWWSPDWLYAWLKAAHIVAVISWMAGMLYLPRLFVYHTAAERGSVQSETFKVMERRLFRGIITPAMLATWVFGLWLAYDGSWFGAWWLNLKFLFVIALSGLYGFFAIAVREFAEDRNARPQRFYRILNEVPTLIMIVVVILVVVKPF